MNFFAERKMFYVWLETHPLSASGIALWHALMYIADCSGWQPNLRIPLSAIMLRSGLSRSTIYEQRRTLLNFGIIDFTESGGSGCGIYRINSFESGIMSEVVSGNRTQMQTQPGTQSRIQTPENKFASEVMSDNRTQPRNIYTPDQTSILEKDKARKSSKNEKRKSCAKKESFDLSFVDDPVWEEILRTWLEYKRSRNQSYKSELSVKKFLTMLRNLSGDNSGIAQQIIDRSIANGWAGIFELPAAGNPRGQPPNRSATGQRIGQIKQPEDEARRQQLIDKFGKKKP